MCNRGRYSPTPAARWLCVFLTCVASSSLRPAAGAEICEVAGVGRVLPAADGLTVVAASSSTLHPDDVLLQLNAKRLRTCADLSAALSVADREQLVPVLALRRGEALLTVILQRPTPMATQVEIAPTVAPLRPPTPMTLADGDRAPLQQMVTALRTFDEQTALPLVAPQQFSRRLEELHQTYGSLRAQAAAVGAAEIVLRYYDTARDILAYKEERATRRPSLQGASSSERARSAPGAAFEYTSDSPVPDWLDRYAFLRPAVVRRPRRVVGDVEEAGQWEPDEAIRLLIGQARAEIHVIALHIERPDAQQ